MSMSKSRPVGAFLPEEEYKMFCEASNLAKKDKGECARIALVTWAKGMVTKNHEADHCDGFEGTEGEEGSHSGDV